MTLRLCSASDTPALASTAEPCPACESARVVATRERCVFAYGEGGDAVNLEAEHLVYRCDDCGLEFTGEDAEIARHEAVCTHHGLLTPREIVAIRNQYRVGRAEFARITRLGEATIARWERGALLQNASNNLYLQLLAVPENWRRVAGLEFEQTTSRSPSIPKFRAQKILSSEAAFRSQANSFMLTKSA